MIDYCVILILGDSEDLDISKITTVLLSSDMNKHKITIHENHGLNGQTGFWWLRFTFHYKLEKAIEVRLTNFKHPRSHDWTLEMTKCHY